MKNIITKRGLMLLIFTISISISAYAQLKTVTGKVKDNFGSLAGTSVLIKGTTRGVTTDNRGRYQIQVLASDVLVFSYEGYTTQEVAVGGKSTIDVIMHEAIANYLAHDRIIIHEKSMFLKEEENEWKPQEHHWVS